MFAKGSSNDVSAQLLSATKVDPKEAALNPEAAMSKLQAVLLSSAGSVSESLKPCMFLHSSYYARMGNIYIFSDSVIE